MGQLPLAKPVRQIKEDAGNVTGLGYSEQKPQNVQVERRSREAGQDSHNSPANQYASNPDTSADPVHEQIAGYLEDEIPEEEDSCQQSILLAGDGEFLIHR